MSTIVERPERLRAINIGIATVMARTPAGQVGTSQSDESIDPPPDKDVQDEDDLASAIGRLNITSSNYARPSDVVEVVKSSTKLNILNHAAVKFIHGDIEGDVYLERIIALARESREKIASGSSEIPDGWPQGDLYSELWRYLFHPERDLI